MLLFGVVALAVTALTGAAVAATAAKKPAAKKPVIKPKIGIKKTPQMAGAVGRFGDLYALKSGWTFQVLKARYSYDGFDEYDQSFPGPDQKFLILQIAIKNNTPADNWFDTSQHQFQIQDTNNQLYTGGFYRLGSTRNQQFSANLKPGQGAWQDASSRLEVAIPVAGNAKVSKIILQKGRKGAPEDVMRFFVAGTQDGDPKNLIAPALVSPGAAPIKPGGFVPSHYFQFRVNGVTFVPGPVAGNEAPENRRFAVVNLTFKNITSAPVGYYDFIGDSFADQKFTDADGENYPASTDIGLLKGSADEQTNGDFPPGQEKTLRLVFAVPTTGELKTLNLSSTRGVKWIFDASGWK